MARPKPVIISEIVDQKTYKSEQILEAEAVYSVFYDGNAINLRIINTLVSYPGPKYKKCNFSTAASALNLAERLNKKFKTDKFTVHKLEKGEVYTRDMHKDSL